MAIANTSTAFTAFYASGTTTPSIKYNRSLTAGTTVIVAYGGSILDATSAHNLSAATDTAGNVYTVYANAGTANSGATPYGAAGIALCRLTYDVTTATTLNFTLSATHNCAFIGYAATGATGTAAGTAWTGRQEGTTASATVTPTAAPSMVYVAVNYFRDTNLATTPTASGTGASVLGFFDTKTKHAVGLVARAATDTTTAITAGLTYSASLPYTAKAVAVGEYVIRVAGSQVIAMF